MQKPSCSSIRPASRDFEFRRKRAGQLACKGRYAAVQLTTYLESGIWKRNAERANRLAARIAAAAPELLSVPAATNQVFMQLGEQRIAALSREFGSIRGVRPGLAKRASSAPGIRPTKT